MSKDELSIMETDRIQFQSEEYLFIDMIEDILRTTRGLLYQLYIFDSSECCDNDGAYAEFKIETNPEYELEVIIKLFKDDFRLRINDEEFSHPLENRKRIDRWFERRCRDIEQLVRGDLKIEVETIFGRYLSSGLFAGSNDRLVEIADRDEGWGWIGLAAWLLPFGLSPLKSHETEYRNWFEID